MAIVYSNFFGGAFFGGGFFGAGVETTPDQPSNWQANYWHNKSKADWENLAMLERIKLGILPAELRAEADDAIRDADEAQRALAADGVTPESAVGVLMQSRAAYDEAFKTAYKESYIAEAVAEAWKSDMKRITRRRKAAMLLLH